MANVSALHAIAVNIRAAGSKDPRTGIVYGGIYFPDHRTREGKILPAHWEGNVFINHLGYTDSQGNYVEPSNDLIRVTAWNGRNSAPGKGLADLFAKIVSVGKEFSCSLTLKQYNKRLFINNTPMADQNGQPITYPSYNWTVKDDLIWGDDAANVIAQEIANWAAYPNPTFFSRPAYWNVPGHADHEAWKYILQQRMALVYNGESVYGYARVMIPEGAQLVNRAQMQTSAPQMQPAQPQTGMMPAMQPAQPMQPMQPMQQPQMQPAQPQPMQTGMMPMHGMQPMQTGMAPMQPVTSMPSMPAPVAPTAAATGMGAMQPAMSGMPGMPTYTPETPI